MGITKINDKVYSVGVLNPNMRIFDVIMKTEYGTSYNSYIIKGSEKIALVETVHHSFYDEYIEYVKEICGDKAPNYIIMNHNEPDHSGVLSQILEYYPNIQVVVSQAGSLYLKNITNKILSNVIIARDGFTLDLGSNDVLKFINAPFLHWPDSMFTWFESEKTLFSCDFLGSHYCEPRMKSEFISYPKAYESAFLNYYNAIFSPFKPYVLSGLEKIKNLEINTICPSHGPVLDGEDIKIACDKYFIWSQPHKNAVKTIPIFYCTAYGNTRSLATQISKGILNVIPDAEINIYNINDYAMSDLSAKIHTSDAFLIGSPTINRDAVLPVWSLISTIDAVSMKDKPCAVFGSFGWSGEAFENLTARLRGIKLKVFDKHCKAQFVPSESELEQAFTFGVEFAETL